MASTISLPNRCTNQAYISFGLAIAAATEQKVDATYMEGFDNEKWMNS